jgi:hypothetical protein
MEAAADVRIEWIPFLLALGVLCGVVATVLQFRLLAMLNATRPADQQIRWYATGDYGTGWSVYKEHLRVFPSCPMRIWMVSLWLAFAVCAAVAGVLLLTG